MPSWFFYFISLHSDGGWREFPSFSASIWKYQFTFNPSSVQSNSSFQAEVLFLLGWDHIQRNSVNNQGCVELIGPILKRPKAVMNWAVSKCFSGFVQDYFVFCNQKQLFFNFFFFKKLFIWVLRNRPVHYWFWSFHGIGSHQNRRISACLHSFKGELLLTVDGCFSFPQTGSVTY